jgi:hypothetical protein
VWWQQALTVSTNVLLAASSWLVFALSVKFNDVHSSLQVDPPQMTNNGLLEVHVTYTQSTITCTAFKLLPLQVLQAMPAPRRRLVIFKAGGYIYRCVTFVTTNTLHCLVLSADQWIAAGVMEMQLLYQLLLLCVYAHHLLLLIVIAGCAFITPKRLLCVLPAISCPGSKIFGYMQ